MTESLNILIRSRFRTLKIGKLTRLVRMRMTFPKVLKVELFRSRNAVKILIADASIGTNRLGRRWERPVLLDPNSTLI